MQVAVNIDKMKFIILYKTVLAFIVLMIISSCGKKIILYPSEPVITYKDFIRYGDPSNPDSVKLVVSFTDNEGDVGLDKADTQGIFKYGNLFMVYYYDSLGHWAAYDPNPAPPFDTLKFSYRVPPLHPQVHDPEPTTGIIYAKQYPFISPFKKIKYGVYMYDKAMHKSNTIETPAIQL